MRNYSWRLFIYKLIFSAAKPVLAADIIFNQPDQRELSDDKRILLTSEDHSFYHGEFDSNLPDPVPGEPEEQGEKEDSEKEEKVDSFGDDLKITLNDSGNLFQSLEKVQTKQLFQSLQNRKIIPFFILFQNWKSFLS